MLNATAEEQAMIDQVPVGALFKHYKDLVMKILAVARHTEDNSLYVVYQKQYNCPKYGDRAIVIRPLAMFLENVTVNGNSLPRFTLLESPPK